MKAIVGVFKSRSDAEVGAAALVPLKIPRARINVLTPEVTDKEIAAVPTMASEQPGMGEAMGAVVGGAMGVAGGVGFAPAVASCLTSTDSAITETEPCGRLSRKTVTIR